MGRISVFWMSLQLLWHVTGIKDVRAQMHRAASDDSIWNLPALWPPFQWSTLRHSRQLPETILLLLNIHSVKDGQKPKPKGWLPLHFDNECFYWYHCFTKNKYIKWREIFIFLPTGKKCCFRDIYTTPFWKKCLLTSLLGVDAESVEPMGPRHPSACSRYYSVPRRTSLQSQNFHLQAARSIIC